jgi:O-antigen ligase
LWAKWWWRPIQAHNGYIETYLNLGFVGIALFAGMILSTFQKISRALLTNFQFARFRMGFLFVILLYNFTEATFKGVSIVWTVFYLIAIDYPRMNRTGARVAKNGRTKRRLPNAVSADASVSPAEASFGKLIAG